MQNKIKELNNYLIQLLHKFKIKKLLKKASKLRRKKIIKRKVVVDFFIFFYVKNMIIFYLFGLQLLDLKVYCLFINEYEMCVLNRKYTQSCYSVTYYF